MGYADNKAYLEVKDALRRPNVLYTSDFLDEREQGKIESLLRNINREYRFFGGYEEADRKVLVIAPEYEELSDYDFPICSITFDKNFDVEHRNILGTFMSLGVSRDTVGDIAIFEDQVQIVVLERMANYFLENLRFINNHPIEPEYHYLTDIIPYNPPYDIEVSTAASNRIDAIVASAFKMSRKKALELLKQNLILHNHNPVSKITVSVKEGDTISVRKKGKIRISSLGGLTKKGRLRFEYFRYR